MGLTLGLMKHAFVTQTKGISRGLLYLFCSGQQIKHLSNNVAIHQKRSYLGAIWNHEIKWENKHKEKVYMFYKNKSKF